MDLTEFDNVHPMLKEIYQEIVLKGYLPLFVELVNEFLTTNDIDKWYKVHKIYIKDIIKYSKLISKKYINTKNFAKMDLNYKVLLQSLKIKEFSEKLLVLSKSIKFDKETSFKKDINVLKNIFYNLLQIFN